MTDTTATLSYDHDLGELPSVAAGRTDGSVASDELRDTLEDPLAVQMSADHARALEGAGGAAPSKSAIQQAFGQHELSSVRAHVGGGAAAEAASMGASAFTAGSDIEFKAPPDLRTAAHEAAHVVQQRDGIKL